jgi:hypothetical protein
MNVNLNFGGNKMESKNLIIMIVVVLGFLSGQLTAEDVAGKSIFPNIETPYPYPAAVKGKTLVWSTTIQEPAAAWIKIHFSKFLLNEGDYVDMVDMNGSLIERIKGKDVSKKAHSKFNVKSDVNKTASFWGPAVDGNKVTVELHSTPNREKGGRFRVDKAGIEGKKRTAESHSTSNTKEGLGFIIDEVGIGSKPILDRRIGPIYNTEDEKKMVDETFCNSRPKITRLGSRKNDVDVLSSTLGKMLYRKGSTWHTCKGSLRGVTGNHFLPAEACIDSLDVLDTLEVRFFIEYTTRENVSTLPGYYTYYSGSSANGNSITYHGDIILRNDDKMIYIEPQGEEPNKKVPLPDHFFTADDYWAYETVNDQETLDTWEQENFDPPLNQVSQVPPDGDQVLDITTYANDENDNWYNVIIRMNTEGDLAQDFIEQTDPPSSSQAVSADGISHPSYIFPWHPRCCGLQNLYCYIFQTRFWWRSFYITCVIWYPQCYNYNDYYPIYGWYHPCYRFGKWGLIWLLYIWFSAYW